MPFEKMLKGQQLSLTEKIFAVVVMVGVLALTAVVGVVLFYLLIAAILVGLGLGGFAYLRNLFFGPKAEPVRNSYEGGKAPQPTGQDAPGVVIDGEATRVDPQEPNPDETATRRSDSI